MNIFFSAYSASIIKYLVLSFSKKRLPYFLHIYVGRKRCLPSVPWAANKTPHNWPQCYHYIKCFQFIVKRSQTKCLNSDKNKTFRFSLLNHVLGTGKKIREKIAMQVGFIVTRSFTISYLLAFNINKRSGEQ